MSSTSYATDSSAEILPLAAAPLQAAGHNTQHQGGRSRSQEDQLLLRQVVDVISAVASYSFSQQPPRIRQHSSSSPVLIAGPHSQYGSQQEPWILRQ
jgi:hypothetical protein